ncbi:MAG: thiamine phosphate synthase [Acidimicrobiales bacterium]
MRIGERRLYLCTPDREDLASFIEACVAGGVDVVQLREKLTPPSHLLSRANLARRVCADLGVPFIVNDSPQLAVECEADGVHVGQDDMAASEARRIVGPERIVGLSTHEPAQLEVALGEPVDYVSAGPVVPTPTKPGRPGTGLGYVAEAAALCAAHEPAMPFFVTGNARPDTVGEIVHAGARRVVAVRWLTEASDPRRSARELRDALDRAIAAAQRAET